MPSYIYILRVAELLGDNNAPSEGRTRNLMSKGARRAASGSLLLFHDTAYCREQYNEI